MDAPAPQRHGNARRLRRVALLVAAAGAAGLAFVYSGVYDVAATRQHTWPVYWATDTVMRHSVARRAQSLPLPADLRAPARAQRGLHLYRRHCVQCHGAPGVSPEPFALGLLPVPANLVETARRWPQRNLYWVIAHGVKMTGMPAWKYRLNETEIWDVVAFMERMTQLSPNEYAAWVRRADAQAARAEPRR